MITRTQIETIPFDREKVLEIISLNQFARGEFLDELSCELATTFRKKHCVLCSSGSAALILTIISMKPSAKVLVPAASTCYSIPNSVLAAGAVPIFCDLDPKTGNLCVEEALRIFEKDPYDLVISPNHFGIPSNIEPFCKLEVGVIEDCAQSVMTNAIIGVRGDVGILSFYPTKYLNGMDGGGILTNDESVCRVAIDTVYYDKQTGYDGRARFNFRLTNLHSYLAFCSLSALSAKIDIFANLYKKFIRSCSALGLEYLHSETTFVPHRFIIKLDSKAERDSLMKLLRDNSIEGAVELMMVSETRKEPNALELSETTMSLPFHQGISDAEIEKIFEVINHGI